MGSSRAGGAAAAGLRGAEDQLASHDTSRRQPAPPVTDVPKVAFYL